MSVAEGDGVVVSVRKDPGFGAGYHKIRITDEENMGVLVAQIKSSLVTSRIRKGEPVRYRYDDTFPGYIVAIANVGMKVIEDTHANLNGEQLKRYLLDVVNHAVPEDDYQIDIVLKKSVGP